MPRPDEPLSATGVNAAPERPFTSREPQDPSLDDHQMDPRARPHASETDERQAGWERGREARRARREGREPKRTHDIPLIAFGPFAALSENVRDYAIFLLNTDGVIIYWGEGARLMKWWTRDEAEGAHLRILYPEGGSEDGTAEEHLRQSAQTGEYVGEGQRVRSDNSKFWAGITLTALRDKDQKLIGFAKVNRDLTARLAVEAALAMTGSARAERDAALEQVRTALAARDAAREHADFAFEQARSARDYIQRVLEPELASLRIARANELLEQGDPPPVDGVGRDPS